MQIGRIGRSSACALGASLLALGAASCTRAAAPAKAGAPIARGEIVERIEPSRLFPDLATARGTLAQEDGYRRVLVDRVRVFARDDGAIERAAELLPQGNVTSIELPSRLGGGFAFLVRTNGTTRLYRAATWLGALTPVIELSGEAAQIVPGFDRLYLRQSAMTSLLAIDPTTGDELPLAPLPPASSYGEFAFADGWRAIVDTDLRGPLVTFDAGATWKPLGIKERVVSVRPRGESLVVQPMNGGEYVVDARGAVTFNPLSSPPPSSATPFEPDAPLRNGPFGKRPLRAALEDGVPDSKTTAVVARKGAVARVSLADGSVVALVEDAFPDRLADCHGIRLGAGWGFACGERDGATSLYALASDLRLEPVLRFAKPRFVAASGNGAVVIRGGCKDDASAPSEQRPYCVRSASGATREILIKGDLGVERVVGLADGRVAVLVPPRGGSDGQITLLDGVTGTSAKLRLPDEPKSVARELRRGLWLEGLEEREKGVLSGWVEAGGPFVGVRVALDGKVDAGDLRDDPGGVVMSGRFALALDGEGHAAESSDGGFVWRVFDLPRREEGSKTRACGAVGCALGGWLRVGWGKPLAGEDEVPGEPPGITNLPVVTKSPPRFRCVLEGSAGGDAPKVATKVAPKPPPTKKLPMPPPKRAIPPLPSPVIRRFGIGGQPAPTGWLPFRSAAAPTLAVDEVGYDSGTYMKLVELRAYAWGKHGADWGRTGRWLVRFDDRYDPLGTVRSSAVSSSPWNDEASASYGIQGNYGEGWDGALDPSGHALFARNCTGFCFYYAIADGQPVQPIRAEGGGLLTSYPYNAPNGAVRIGESWFFLTPAGQQMESVGLWRADLGVARPIATFPHAMAAEYPMLVRRANGTGLGLLIGGTIDPGERQGRWYVIPIDPESGALGDVIDLGERELGARLLDRCPANRDGWLLDTMLAHYGPYPVFELEGGQAPLAADASFRLRLDPGMACVDAIATRINGAFVKDKTTPKPDAEAVPFTATEAGTNKRWSFRCKARPPSIFKR